MHICIYMYLYIYFIITNITECTHATLKMTAEHILYKNWHDKADLFNTVYLKSDTSAIPRN